MPNATINAETPDSRHACPGAVAALIVFGALSAPLAFPLLGGNGAKTALLLCASAAAMLWLAGDRKPSPAACIIPCAILCLGAIQLLPLPESVLRLISPLAWETVTDLRAAGVDAPWRISLDFSATFAATHWLFLISLLAMATAAAAARPHSARLLAAGLALTGIVLLVLGLAFDRADSYHLLGRDLTGPIKPWKSPLLDPTFSAGVAYPDRVTVGGVSYIAAGPVVGDGFGPYANSNHFGGGLELTMPFAIALLIAFARVVSPARRFTGSVYRSGKPAPRQTDPASRRWLLASAGALGLGTLALLALGVRSRGSLLGVTAAILVSGVLLTRRVWLKFALGGLLAATLIAAFSLFAHFGGQEWAPQPGVPKRLFNDGELRSTSAQRIEAWRAALVLAAEAPGAGIGLGAYGTAGPVFARVSPKPLFVHNDYLQLLAETGVLGVCAAAALITLLLRRILRNLRAEQDPFMRLIRGGALAALAALAVHSCFDFNLHIPANAWLAAVTLGLALAPSGAASPRMEPARTWRKIAPAVTRAVVACFLIVGVYAAMGANRVERTAAPLRQELATQRLKQSNSEELRLAIGQAEQALHRSPWRGDIAELIAAAYLHLSHGRPSPDLERARAWFQRSLRLAPINPSAQLAWRDINEIAPAAASGNQ